MLDFMNLINEAFKNILDTYGPLDRYPPSLLVKSIMILALMLILFLLVLQISLVKFQYLQIHDRVNTHFAFLALFGKNRFSQSILCFIF